MPNYDYQCPVCETDEERNVPVDERDEQTCNDCTHPLTRKWTFRGSVWAPTASNGGTHK